MSKGIESAGDKRPAASSRPEIRSLLRLAIWLAAAAALLAVNYFLAPTQRLPGGLSWLSLLGWVALVLAAADLSLLATQVVFRRRNRPLAEAAMVGRLYRLGAFIAIILVVVYGFGAIGSVGSFFALFGGMLLGWSLQAPVSGFAAWMLVSLKRPFRPGDRIQFPNLGMVGDVKEIGAMYTVLDQVGGTIGSEEAVGRFILVPNALLFSQVVINYTVLQDSPYMLDEVVIRITYDSDWNKAESILLHAAVDITGEIIAATGVKPYIRSENYDYGVYMRLRYQTRVRNRAEIAYKINKRTFEDIQRSPTVDMAIPYVYSFRAATENRPEILPRDKDGYAIQDVAIDAIHDDSVLDPQDVELVAKSIAAQGLLQPIVVVQRPGEHRFDILAGHVRFHACRHLGWKTIAAVIRGSPPRPEPPRTPT